MDFRCIPMAVATRHPPACSYSHDWWIIQARSASEWIRGHGGDPLAGASCLYLWHTREGVYGHLGIMFAYQTLIDDEFDFGYDLFPEPGELLPFGATGVGDYRNWKPAAIRTPGTLSCPGIASASGTCSRKWVSWLFWWKPFRETLTASRKSSSRRPFRSGCLRIEDDDRRFGSRSAGTPRRR